MRFSSALAMACAFARAASSARGGAALAPSPRARSTLPVSSALRRARGGERAALCADEGNTSAHAGADTAADGHAPLAAPAGAEPVAPATASGHEDAGTGAAADAAADAARRLEVLVVRLGKSLALLVVLGLFQLSQLIVLALYALATRVAPRVASELRGWVVVPLRLICVILTWSVIRRLLGKALDAFRGEGLGGFAGRPRPGIEGNPRPSFFDAIAEALDDDRASRSRLRTQIEWVEPGGTGVTFGDVAGCEEAVAEVRQVADFLRNPERYLQLGARVPRGVLLEGPPGTGKTLLAKALASEAGVPFASVPAPLISAQRIAGVSSMFVTELFKNASAKAPCIVYLDEIDSLGGTRGYGAGDVSRDKADALNTLLTAMDGFAGPAQAPLVTNLSNANVTAASPGARAPVVVLASTNRADALDPALLRPGRFDRRVPLRPPDAAGREAVLRICAKRRALSDAARERLAALAARTTGLSGADLEGILNEAALAAAARNASAVEPDDLASALDKVTVGLRSWRTPPAPARAVTAVHEAGHAVVALAAEAWLAASGHELDAPALRLDQCSVAPRAGRAGATGGHTAFRPAEAKAELELLTAKDLLGQMAVAMGGRAAEELEFGKARVTAGAAADLDSVFDVAHTFVERLAMSALGPLRAGGGDGRDVDRAGGAAVAAEVRRLAAAAAEAARSVLRANRATHATLVKELLARETLSRADVDSLFGWPEGGPPLVAGASALERLAHVAQARSADVAQLLLG